MQDKVVEIRGFKFRTVFPWIHLFRVFGIAIDIRKVVLAAFALLMLALGNLVISKLPFAPDAPYVPLWKTEFGYGSTASNSGHVLQLAGGLLDNPSGVMWSAVTNWQLILRPIKDLVEPATALFQSQRGEKPWSEVAYAWTRILWTLTVWSLFGGAICRMSAVQFARDERIGIRSAIVFAGRRFLSYLSAPLLPFVGVGAIWLICFLGGLVGRIPNVGEIIAGVAFIFPLLFGLILALMVIGVGAGWPLMFATISVEGSDGFDGLSRSYNYIYDRPWYYAWMIVVTMVYCSLSVFFVWFATSLLVHLAAWSISAGMGADRVAAILHGMPEILGGPSLIESDFEVLYGASAITGYWLYGVALLLIGFVYSFFWTSSTAIYFLLRQSDDQIELDEVYLPSETPRDELLAMITEDEPAQTAEGESAESDSETESAEAASESENESESEATD